MPDRLGRLNAWLEESQRELKERPCVDKELNLLRPGAEVLGRGRVINEMAMLVDAIWHRFIKLSLPLLPLALRSTC